MPLLSSQSLSWSVLSKYNERIPLFLRMMSEPGIPFTLMNGIEVSIPTEENAPLTVALQTKVRAAVLQSFKGGVVAHDSTGQTHTLTNLGQIHKCRRFGGMPSGHSLKREAGQIQTLSDSLLSDRDLIIRSTRSCQEIRLAGPSGVTKVRGTGKADAIISGNGALRVSLKWADTPSGMNQWGGVSHISQMHPDIWCQFEEIARAWDGHETLVMPLPPDLTGLVPTLWGEGDESVDAILVSRSPLIHDPESGVLQCDRVYLRGEIPEGGWAPSLVLRRFRGRGSKVGSQILNDARVGVYPLQYRSGRVESVNRNERGCIYTLPNAMEV
jgi:hypothetical protein